MLIPQKFMSQEEDDDLVKIEQDQSLTWYLQPTSGKAETIDSLNTSKNKDDKSSDHKFSFVQNNDESCVNQHDSSSDQSVVPKDSFLISEKDDHSRSNYLTIMCRPSS